MHMDMASKFCFVILTWTWSKEKEYIEMMKRNRVDGIIMGSHTIEVEDFKNLHRSLVNQVWIGKSLRISRSFLRIIIREAK